MTISLPAIWERGPAIHPLAHCLPMSPQMNDNQIDNWSDLDELKNAKSLETVYLERNPLQKDPQYRRKIMLALPTVRQIDATFIRFWAAVYNSPDSFSIRQGKKKKKLHLKMLAELCRHSIQKHSKVKRSWDSLDVQVCTYALIHSHLDLMLLLRSYIF